MPSNALRRISAQEVVAAESNGVPDIIASGVRPTVPVRSMLDNFREQVRIASTERVGEAGLRATSRINDVAHAELAGSLDFSSHIVAGFGDSLGDDGLAAIAQLRRIVQAGTVSITKNTTAKIDDLIVNYDPDVPPPNDLDVFVAWLKQKAIEQG